MSSLCTYNIKVDLLFADEPGHRDDHFFQGYATMLEGIAVVVYEVVIVIRIAEVAISAGEYIGRIDVGFGQAGFFRIPEGQYFFRIVVEVTAMFIA